MKKIHSLRIQQKPAAPNANPPIALLAPHAIVVLSYHYYSIPNVSIRFLIRLCLISLDRLSMNTYRIFFVS